jgi:hypothetical protein
MFMPTGTESAAYLFKVRSLASQRLRTSEMLSSRTRRNKGELAGLSGNRLLIREA